MNDKKGGLIDRYTAWLKQFSTEEEIEGGWTVLSLPFLDRHNDHLQVFVRSPRSGGLDITDDGQIIRDLDRTGCNLQARTKRRTIAEKILRNHGLQTDLLDSGELKVTSMNGDFPQKLHGLLLAMLALDGLASVSPANVVSLFKEDVADWLRAIGASFESGVKFQGKSGVTHEFDFRLPPAPAGHERVLHAIPNPDKAHIQSFVYEVMDTRSALNGDSPDFYALLNDTSARASRQYQALLAQQIEPFRWTQRDHLAGKIA
jgi:hypothetical protein